MAEEIKGLIEKIQQEGIRAAQEQARQIELAAQRRADELLAQAKKEAQRLVHEARQNIEKMQESAQADLKRVSRDAVLSLKQEIQRMLASLISSNVRQALTTQELIPMIMQLLKCQEAKDASSIVVSLNKDDAAKVRNDFLAKLKEEIKGGIALKTDDSISAGFMISFDAGNSSFDCTDSAITAYLYSLLNPKLRELLE